MLSACRINLCGEAKLRLPAKLSIGAPFEKPPGRQQTVADLPNTGTAKGFGTHDRAIALYG
jgi:hypothetical protein